MNKESVGYIDIVSPVVDFVIIREDTVPLDNYTLIWNGGKYEGSQIFQNAKLVPTNQNIVFIPQFILPKNNKIIEYKWSFGINHSAIINSKSIEPLTLVTGSSSTNTFTKIGHDLLDNSPVKLTSLIGGSNLNTSTTYYVTNSDPIAGTFNLSTSIGGYNQSLGSNVTNVTINFYTPAIHKYESGLGGTTNSPTCFTATLTAIDKYYRHTRAYKQIYLHD